MATKWKLFKARGSVKAAALFLTIAMSFILCNRMLNLFIICENTGVNPDVVLASIDNGDFFYQKYMRQAYQNAQSVLYYGDEESISSGKYLKWRDTDVHLVLETPDSSNTYAWVSKSDLGIIYSDETSDLPDEVIRSHKENPHPLLVELEQTAISGQISELRSAKEVLKNTDGLLYAITGADGAEILGNTTNSEDFFRNKLVYMTSNGDSPIETSHADRGYYWHAYSIESGAKINLAFTNEAVENANKKYAVVKTAYLVDMIIMICAAILLVAAPVLLIAGAGRRTADGGKSVHLLVIDKLFLDVGFILCAAWIFFTALASYWIIYEIWIYRNITAMNFLFAVASALIFIPLISWLQALSKHVKIGRFWRHTLLWFLPHTFVQAMNSLWAGRKLTAKITLIGLAVFFLLLFTGFIGYATSGIGSAFLSIPITAVIVILLLRYAARIRALEQGAYNASQGAYQTVITAGGGELGRIAESINNISGGINAAVNERTKSERLKTELITNVSHDIRTPLTSIITYADLLKNEGLSCKKAPDYLDVLIEKSGRLKTLTDELFEAAKAASGSIEAHITELDLTALIRQIMGEHSDAITSSALDFRTNLPETVKISADGNLMRRVMENLLSNIFKYSLPGSRVYLDIERPDNSSYVRLDLKNISAAPLNADPSELTERFKRGDESRSDGGSGLGLSIVQSFMLIQGGRLAITIDGDLFKVSLYMPSVGNA